MGGEGEEVAFDVVDALEFPEERGGLGEEVELQGALGVEVLFDFVFEDLVGGGAFIGEEGGIGAEAVFGGVLGGFLFTALGAGPCGFLGVFAVGA